MEFEEDEADAGGGAAEAEDAPRFPLREAPPPAEAAPDTPAPKGPFQLALGVAGLLACILVAGVTMNFLLSPYSPFSAPPS